MTDNTITRNAEFVRGWEANRVGGWMTQSPRTPDLTAVGKSFRST
jgi:hypothetical protein